MKITTHNQEIIKFLKENTWDNNPRLETWLIDYHGADDNQWTRQYCKKWMIGAVARMLDPGCTVQHCLTLKISKENEDSNIFELLSRPITQSIKKKSYSKVSPLAARAPGATSFCLVEFEKLPKTYVKWLHPRISASTSHLRGKDVLREYVFCAQHKYDVTPNYIRENRRWWNVECRGKISESFAEIVDQLWAEAYHEYMSGTQWWESEMHPEKPTYPCH